MERMDFIPKHESLKIIQDDELFLFNSDTMALGEFMEIRRKDKVLDMGTNTGGLLLYASLFHPAEMTGIDINEKALSLAGRNMELNGIPNVKLYHADIKDYTGEPQDVIVCNPPYFETKEENKSQSESMNLAKHEGNLTLPVLIKSIARNLKDSGKLYFIYSAPRLEEVILELKKNNIAVKELKFVFDENKEYANVFLLKGVKNGRMGLQVLKPLIIERK